MILTIKINIVGAKENSFKDSEGKEVKFYNAYDDQGNRFKINADIYKALLSKRVPDNCTLAPDSKLITPDKDIIKID